MQNYQEEEEKEQVEKEEKAFRYPARSIYRRFSAPALDKYDDDDDESVNTIIGCHGRRSSFSYSRLPEHLLKLSILKLDGSSFDVLVARSASVEELKIAVEEVFSQFPKEGEGKISWSHVWGHFCLSYDSHKLIDDKTSLRSLGIKDGDQLQFIRHLSINYIPVKRRPKSHGSATEQNRTSLADPEVHQEWGENGRQDKDNKKSSAYRNCQCTDEGCRIDGNDDEDVLRQSEFRLAHFLRGCLSYTRLWCTGRMKSEGGRSRLSRLSGYYQIVATKEMRL